MRFKKLGELTDESLRELNSIQEGKKLLVKTGFPMIDDHLNGLLPSDIVVLSGLSGHGKSETLSRLRDNIMNVEINPEAVDYIWANFNLEVRSFNVTLRSLNRKLGKKKQDILYNKFTEEEKIKVKEFYEDTQDDRQYVCQDNITALGFYEASRELLLANKSKKAVHIDCDHVALLSGNDIQKGIEDLIRYVNKLKLEFDNAYFYIISQLNRGLLSRVAERNNSSCPNASDLYASSAMDFISSYNIIVFDAHKLGISEFMQVNPERYDYLQNHFTEESNKGKVGFFTEGKLFYKVVKTRESDVSWRDLYIVEKDISKEEKKMYEKKESKISSSLLSGMPNFNEEKKEIFEPKFDLPTPNIEDAFGVYEDESDIPF